MASRHRWLSARHDNSPRQTIFTVIGNAQPNLSLQGTQRSPLAAKAPGVSPWNEFTNRPRSFASGVGVPFLAPVTARGCGSVARSFGVVLQQYSFRDIIQKDEPP